MDQLSLKQFKTWSQQLRFIDFINVPIFYPSNSDGQPYECLKRLFKRRDRLVHYKTRKKKLSEMYEEDIWVTEEQSAEAVATVEAILKELSEIDRTVSMEWLEEAKTNPYV